MPIAEPIVGYLAKVTITTLGNSPVTTTIKNAKHTQKRTANLKEAPNTTDGMLRARGRKDIAGTVSGFTDVTQPIEGDVEEGMVCILKLYRDATHFWSFTAILDNISIQTGFDDVESWSFDYMLHSGDITNPVYP